MSEDSAAARSLPNTVVLRSSAFKLGAVGHPLQHAPHLWHCCWPVPALNSISFEFEGTPYEWRESTGLISRNMKVPESRAFLILAGIAPTLDAIAERLTDPILMVMHGALASRLGHFQRAELLARRALEAEPGYLAAVALLSSVLRQTDRVHEALAVTAPHAYCQEPAVLTTRSAALQDVGRSVEAVRFAKRAWAISLYLPGGPADELKKLYDRLRREGVL